MIKDCKHHYWEPMKNTKLCYLCGHSIMTNKFKILEDLEAHILARYMNHQFLVKLSTLPEVNKNTDSK